MPNKWRAIAIALISVILIFSVVFCLVPVKHVWEPVKLDYEFGPNDQTRENKFGVTILNTSDYYGYFIVEFVVRRVPQRGIIYLNPNQWSTYYFDYDYPPYEVRVTPEIKMVATDKLSMLEYLMR